MSEGSNFKTHTGGKAQKPRRPSRPFIVDETPIVFSLEWLSVRGMMKFGILVAGCYMAVDITRFLLYRLSPTAIPLQPSWTAEVVSNAVQLVAPCRRFPASDLVFTETSVIHDSATYFNPQENARNFNSSSDSAVVSSTIKEELRHHRPRKQFKDRVAEIRAFIGLCADVAANSIVFVSGGASPTELDKVAPPKDDDEPQTFVEANKGKYFFSYAVSSLMKGNISDIFASEQKIAEKKASRERLLQQHLETSGYRGDPFAFDAPSSKWPSKHEQDALAKALVDDQAKREKESGADLWGRRSLSSLTGKSISKPGVVSFTSTFSDISSVSDQKQQQPSDRQAGGQDKNINNNNNNNNNNDSSVTTSIGSGKEDATSLNASADFAGSPKYKHLHQLVDADTMENQLQAWSPTVGGVEQRQQKKPGITDNNNKTSNSKQTFFSSFFYNSDAEIKTVDQLPHRGDTSSASSKLSVPVGNKPSPSPATDATMTTTTTTTKEPAASSSRTSGSEVKSTAENSMDDSLHRFVSLHFEPHGTLHSGGLAASSSLAPTELRVKCLDAASAGGTRSRCSVDANVLCAPRHRSMLAALAMLPDPLPTHLQVATFGVGPTAIASFMFKNFAAHLKRLDVVAEPALFEHQGILDFGLTARHGPVCFHPSDEEKFLLRSDKKYDLLFISSADKVTGERGRTRFEGEYLSLVRKSLSSVGIAAIEMHADDLVSQRAVQTVFGMNNVFFVPVKTNSSDLVALAAYALPKDGVWKRHIVARAEDISYTFKLPYDIAAHLPLSWEIW